MALQIVPKIKQVATHNDYWVVHAVKEKTRSTRLPKTNPKENNTIQCTKRKLPGLNLATVPVMKPVTRETAVGFAQTRLHQFKSKIVTHQIGITDLINVKTIEMVPHRKSRSAPSIAQNTHDARHWKATFKLPTSKNRSNLQEGKIFL